MLILHCGITGGKSEAFRNFLRTMETFRLISHIPQKPGPCVEYYENGQHMEPENIRYVTKEFSQGIVNNPVYLIYLFQCFNEAQDEELCEDLVGYLAGSLVNLNNLKLLPYQVASLGFFLSKCCED